MREIKFRAWDTTNKKWINLSRFALDPLTGSILGAYDPDEFYIYDASDYEIMQYTGLKDKNGKEIYEGDILSFVLDGLVQVKWFDEKASFNPAISWEVYEVIGNIYENPELFK